MIAAALAMAPSLPSRAAPSSGDGNPFGLVPASGSGISTTNSTTTVLNLLGGATTNASGQIYTGYLGKTDKNFPEIETGSTAMPEDAWENFSHVLELAPPVFCGCGNWHAAGLTLFSTQPGTSATLFSNITLADYPAYGWTADGVEAYLFVSPVLRSNGTFAYFATSNGNTTLTTKEGAVIFPYSSSPYVVVQWDPGYETNGTSAVGEYNLYMVQPGTGGVVTSSDITAKSDLGNGTGFDPLSGNVIEFAASYSAPTTVLSVHLIDDDNPTLVTNLSVNLSKTYSFSPSYSQTGTYDLGLGGSANNGVGWGALSISAITAPVPTGDDGVALSTNPGSCGTWYGAVGGSTSFAPNETSVVIASGGTISFSSAPMCEKYAWNATAGAATGAPYTFKKWLLFGGLKFVSGYSATSTTIEVTVSALGGLEGVYTAASTDTPYDAGWTGYYGNRTVYPTQDTTPFAIQPETTGNVTQTTSASDGGWKDGGYDLVNNSATVSALPLYKYNASAEQFQLYMTSTVDSEVWVPCWYATYKAFTGSINPYNPGTENFVCYPIALMDAAEHVTGLPASAVTNITGIFGTNISAQNTNTSTWDGYLPKGLNGSSVNIGPWAADAIDAYNLGDDLAGSGDVDSLLYGDAPWLEQLDTAQSVWDGAHVGYDILDAIAGAGFPLSVAGNFVHDMIPFLNNKWVNTVSQFVVDVIFTIALCETIVGCAVGVALDIVSALLNYFGWELPGQDNGPWNGVHLNSTAEVKGNGTVQDWAVTNDTAVNASGDSCWWNSPCDHSLYACWDVPTYCGNNTYEEGMVAETSIPLGSLGKVSSGAVNLTGANELWRYDVCAEEDGCEGGYDNSYFNCTNYMPCAYQGATTTTLSYPLEPAISLGGTVTDGGVPAVNATVTLSQTYGGKLTYFTSQTNLSGYWHFFARPGATYTYTVTPAGTKASPSVTIPAAETAAAATGDNVSLGTFVYGSYLEETGFQETGLVPGTAWTLWLNSTGSGAKYAVTSEAPVLDVLAANGSYTWVASYAGATGIPPKSSSSLTIPTSTVTAVRFTTYSVSFTAEFTSPPTYPLHTPWSLWLNSTPDRWTSSVTTVNSSVTVSLPNGTYSYTVGSGANRVALPSSGTLTIAGVGPSETVGFSPYSTFNVSASPGIATYDPANGYLYVPDTTSSNVTVVNGATDKIVTTITVGSDPLRGTYDPRNGDIYIPDSNSYDVSVISGATDTVVGTVAGNWAPHSATYDPTNGEVYVPCWTQSSGRGGVDVISGTTLTKNVSVGTNPLNAAYDATTNEIYVANSGSSNVSVISGSSNTLTTTVKVGSSPGFVGYSPANGDLYVPNPGSGNVTVISGATNKVVANVTVGSSPRNATYDPANEEVYVTNAGSNSVSVLGTTNQVIATISVGAEPLFGVYDTANADLYVDNDNGATLSMIDGATNSVVATIPTGPGPWAPVYDPGNSGVYVANTGASTMTEISTGTPLVAVSPSVQKTPTFPAYDARNGYLYVPNNGSGTVSVVNPVTNKVLTNITVGSNPWSVTYDSSNGYIYVMNSGSNTVTVLNGTSVVGSAIKVGTTPRFATFDSANGDLYVADTGGTNVTVISGATDAVVANVPVKAGPWWGTYDPGNGGIYIPDIGGSTVTEISGTTNKAVANITVGTGPGLIGYDPANGYLYVPNTQGGSNVTVINGATNSVVTSIDVAAGAPHSVTYDPDNGDIYIPAWGGDVTIANASTYKIVATIVCGTNPFFAIFDPGNGLVFITNSASSNLTVLNGTTILTTFSLPEPPGFGVYLASTGELGFNEGISGTVSLIGNGGSSDP